MKPFTVTVLMKAAAKHFSVVMFVSLSSLVRAFEPLGEVLRGDH